MVSVAQIIEWLERLDGDPDRAFVAWFYPGELRKRSHNERKESNESD